MKRSLLLSIFAFCIFSAKSQNLSFNCPKDSILGCNATCLTIKSQFPDIRSLATDYTIKNVSGASGCRPYVDPGVPGTPASISNDDTYSSVINLPFGFPFYGVTYNSLVASTNGYVSFDNALSGNFSHYGIMNSGGFLTATTGNPPENLPSSLYDRALIMGPYHDLDPSVSQPTQLIKYDVFGTAPNRKWILSFYRVPLFQAACNSLIENTSQLIIHESTGIIEVFVKDQQICNTWNEGRAMIGLQDFARTTGIMAPGRQASDPAWGTIGMNETWRFVPKDGTPLYRSVQLLDATGAVIATGDTTRLDISTFETSFPNICPPPGTTLYVVKTTYQKIDDPTPGSTIYSLDTIRVIRQAALPVSATMTATTCGLSTGTITVTVAGGVGPYIYSLDGGPTQAGNVFTGVAAGSHTVFAQDAGGCNNTFTITVTSISSLPSTVATTATSCPGVNNGTITVTPTAGTAPYTYTLNGGPSQPSGAFTLLAAGTYTINFADVNGCTGTATATVSAGTSLTSTSVSVSTSCSGVNNGSTTVTPTSGTGPYSFSIDGGPSQPTGVFTGLAAGSHTVAFSDVNGCTGTRFIFISTGTGITSSATFTATSCPGVNNGTITITPSNGTLPYSFSIDGGPVQASNIFSGVSAGTHTITIKDASNCTGTKVVNVTSGPAIGGTAGFTGTSCPTVNNGTITATPTSGTAPYTYSLDGGAFVASNTFSNLSAGPHTVTIQDFNGCTGTVSATITAGTGLTGTASPVSTSCPTVNNGSITVTPASGTAPYQYSLNGGPTQASNTFQNLAPGSYTITFTDFIGCVGTASATVLAGSNISSTLAVTNPACANINDGIITVTPTSGTTPYQYSLNGGPLQNSNTFTGLAPGSYLITINDNIGCTGSNNANLVTNSPIISPAVLAQPLCFGNTNGSITLSPSGGVSPYQYSIDAGVNYQPNATISGLGAGTYTIRIKDFAGCTKDTTILLGQPSLLTASAVNAAPASCSGNDGTISINGSGGTSPYQYSIDNGTNYQAGNIITAPAVGAYPNIRVKDANGCIANASTTVILIDGMFLTLGPDTTICFGKSVKLLSLTSAGTSVYNWRPLDPLVTLPATIDSPQIRNATVTPTDTASYILNAKWGTCVREDTIIVNVLHKPVAHAGRDTAICNETFAILRGSATNLSGPVYFVWSPAATVEHDSLAVTMATPGSNTQLYILTVTDNYGCSFTVKDSVLVTVQPPVPAFAGNDTIAIRGVPHQLFGSGGVDYLWSPSFPLNMSTAPNPLATLTNDQQFVLKVTDIAGCIGYDTVFVQVFAGPTYYVPNAFSPNGDGMNDIFRAIPVGIVQTDWFRVFNRYGELVFETNQWLKGWDGKYKGKKQPMGVYIWIVKGIDKNGKMVEMKGTVMLVE